MQLNYYKVTPLYPRSKVEELVVLKQPQDIGREVSKTVQAEADLTGCRKWSAQQAEVEDWPSSLISSGWLAAASGRRKDRMSLSIGVQKVTNLVGSLDFERHAYELPTNQNCRQTTCLRVNDKGENQEAAKKRLTPLVLRYFDVSELWSRNYICQ